MFFQKKLFFFLFLFIKRSYNNNFYIAYIFIQFYFLHNTQAFTYCFFFCFAFLWMHVSHFVFILSQSYCVAIERIICKKKWGKMYFSLYYYFTCMFFLMYFYIYDRIEEKKSACKCYMLWGVYEIVVVLVWKQIYF